MSTLTKKSPISEINRASNLHYRELILITYENASAQAA